LEIAAVGKGVIEEQKEEGKKTARDRRKGLSQKLQGEKRLKKTPLRGATSRSIGK